MFDPVTCTACKGVGWFDIGECEDGIIEACQACDGEGETDDED